MSIRAALLSVAMCLCVTIAASQAVLPDRASGRDMKQQVFGLGFDGGFAGGVGIAFRHHLPGPFSYQVTGGIIKVDERLMYSVGGQLQFDLVRGAASRFFTALAAGYYCSAKSGGENRMAAPTRVGLGIGAEVPFASGFHGSVSLLFTYFSDGTVLPLPQVGFYYYFY
jgi:hypothetical protein